MVWLACRIAGFDPLETSSLKKWWSSWCPISWALCRWRSEDLQWSDFPVVIPTADWQSRGPVPGSACPLLLTLRAQPRVSLGPDSQGGVFPFSLSFCPASRPEPIAYLPRAAILGIFSFHGHCPPRCSLMKASCLALLTLKHRTQAKS